ncbi:hypothetical protein VTO42DRAFT_282 [Malbranchea cinnamomea]
MVGLNAHERPPEPLRQLYKKLRRATPAEIECNPQIVDLQRPQDKALTGFLHLERRLSRESLDAAFDQFIGSSSWRQSSSAPQDGVPIYTHRAVPGLQIIPSLLPPPVQIELLSRLLHRDLCDKRHQTNVHLHYHMSYPTADENTAWPRSFFQDDPKRLLAPKDPAAHAPLSVESLLSSKLRWVTLGGQYNWTEKTYPDETPPAFPGDIATLLHRIFPDTNAEAAIVNIYSPGDTLSVHRDVSEECDAGLISVSFGCDCLFMIGNNHESSCAVLRLRSGDAVYMAGPSRFSWHAVPKILPSTCPAWLQHWPGDVDTGSTSSPNPFNRWRNWMAGKRVNLNVRQMKPKLGPENV